MELTLSQRYAFQRHRSGVGNSVSGERHEVRCCGSCKSRITYWKT